MSRAIYCFVMEASNINSHLSTSSSLAENEESASSSVTADGKMQKASSLSSTDNRDAEDFTKNINLAKLEECEVPKTEDIHFTYSKDESVLRKRNVLHSAAVGRLDSDVNERNSGVCIPGKSALVVCA